MAREQDNQPLLVRFRILQIVLCAILALLTLRVWQLSILDFRHYDERARNNRIRNVSLMAPRGLILDRHGEVLVDNTDALKLVLYPDDIADRESTFRFLAEGLGEDVSDLEARISEEMLRSGLFRPIAVRSTLTLEQVAFFKARQSEHPEVRTELRPLRIYRNGNLAAHVLGYVGEIEERQLQQDHFKGRTAGDLVGKFGIEYSLNEELTGVDGVSMVQVNSVGKAIGELRRTEPIQGRTIELTLDRGLQEIAEEALGASAGAVVAIDPRNGAVLVLASLPSFDPNDFAIGLSRTQWQGLNGPEAPLRNRAIQSAISPGSTFKPIMAATGLETNVVDLRTRVFCPGYAEIYGHLFRCHSSGGHGWVGLEEAIEKSCNVYFYQMGRNLKIDQIHDYSLLFGLGVETGIELPGEVSGLVPSTIWKRRVRKQPWYPGETISVSIGQGPINVSPIQLARAGATLATGRKPNLSLIKSGSENTAGQAPESLQIAPNHVEAIRAGMWRAVNNHGTARRARVEGFDVCGKTGTAQVISRQTREKLSNEEAKRFEDNAWFLGFAPRDDPEIVVVVMVQSGGGGGKAAAPIAGQVFQSYFDRTRGRESDDPRQPIT